jgi:hypothetical protein
MVTVRREQHARQIHGPSRRVIVKCIVNVTCNSIIIGRRRRTGVGAAYCVGYLTGYLPLGIEGRCAAVDGGDLSDGSSDDGARELKHSVFCAS